MIPKNQIPVQRRIAEAISAKMHYDFLCFRGSIMGEAYLAHCIAEVLTAFFDQQKHRARSNFPHPSMPSKGRGRKPEIDYIVEDLLTKEIELAVEAKWAGSSHCSESNILWDLVRLKALKDSSNKQCSTYFLLAGTSKDVENAFKSSLFTQGTESPLILGSSRKKKFSLSANRHHQDTIEKNKEKWLKRYSTFPIPDFFETKLEHDSNSAKTNARFAAKIWQIT